MAQLIPVYGDVEEVKYEGREISLAKMQELVEGYIEIVYLQDKIMVINEEGKFTHPKNEWATQLAKDFLMIGDFISGPAILLDRGEIS